ELGHRGGAVVVVFDQEDGGGLASTVAFGWRLGRRVGLGANGRQLDHELGALAEAGARTADAAAVQLDDAAADRQAEAESDPPLARLVVLFEEREDAIEVLAADAAATVPYGDRQPSWLVAGLNGDVALARRVANRVAQDVPQDLLQACGVGAHMVLARVTSH